MKWSVTSSTALSGQCKVSSSIYIRPDLHSAEATPILPFSENTTTRTEDSSSRSICVELDATGCPQRWEVSSYPIGQLPST